MLQIIHYKQQLLFYRDLLFSLNSFCYSLIILAMFQFSFLEAHIQLITNNSPINFQILISAYFVDNWRLEHYTPINPPQNNISTHSTDIITKNSTNAIINEDGTRRYKIKSNQINFFIESITETKYNTT